jgi:16S rRNA (adenine1518-N6/adenine1519-N6)-dimethyltransferase
MANSAIGSSSRTKEIMRQYGLHAKKGYGQNFLTDQSILQNIVSAAEISKDDNVIEIGPGIGALTEQLAQAAGQVVGLEIDADLLPVLKDVLSPYDNVKILHQDVLKADLPALIQAEFDHPQAPIKVVANLPYYITSPILMRLLNSPVDWDCICVMMQREVADRLTAKVGTKQYGSLTLAIEMSMDAKMAFGVSRHSFVPEPNVDSAIVTLHRRKQPLAVAPFDRDKVLQLIKICFAHRRKNLGNNLKALSGKDSAKKAAVLAILMQLHIDSRIRPEQLTLVQFIQLGNALHDHDLF